MHDIKVDKNSSCQVASVVVVVQVAKMILFEFFIPIGESYITRHFIGLHSIVFVTMQSGHMQNLKCWYKKKSI
jgi:hypothetical protein